VQVVFDSASAHEQLGSDVGVGHAIVDELGDLDPPRRLAWRECHRRACARARRSHATRARPVRRIRPLPWRRTSGGRCATVRGHRGGGSRGAATPLVMVRALSAWGLRRRRRAGPRRCWLAPGSWVKYTVGSTW
jgi:hypothetical protein